MSNIVPFRMVDSCTAIQVQSGNGGVFNKAAVQIIALLLHIGSLDIIAKAETW